MRKILSITVIAVFFATLPTSCGTGGLDGTYIAATDAANNSTMSQFIFKGGKVQVVMGTRGINIPGGYEYGFSRDGNKVKIEMGIGGISLGGIELYYDEQNDQISLLSGGETGSKLNEHAPIWTKDGKPIVRNTEPESKDNDETTNENNASDDGGVIKGVFTYSGGYVAGNNDYRNDYKTDFVFSTDYFNKSATSYNHELAIMSLEVAMAAFGLHNQDYGKRKSSNIESLLKNMGFFNIKSCGYGVSPEENTIAVVFGRKNLDKDTELLLIAVRGGEYQKEWGGNFNVGNGSVHKGFEIAKNSVGNYFDSYISEHSNKSLSNKKIKLWITGYSRAAAVANLLSADFINFTREDGVYEGYGTPGNKLALSLKSRNIYSYCFATPNNSKQGQYEGYENIFNIISPFDPVPKFPFASWGFKKYGRIKLLPSPKVIGYKKMEKNMLVELKKLESSFDEYSYFVDDFRVHKGNTGTYGWQGWFALYDMGRHDQGRFNETMDDYLIHLVESTIRSAMGTQKDYAKNKETSAIRAAMALNRTGDVKGFMGAITAEGVLDLNKIGLVGGNNDDIVTLGPSDEHLKRLGDGDDNVTNLKKEDRVPALYRFTEGSEFYDTRADAIMKERGFNKKDARREAVTEAAREAKNNSHAVSSGHYPELYLAWLKSLDTSYFN